MADEIPPQATDDAERIEPLVRELASKIADLCTGNEIAVATSACLTQLVNMARDEPAAAQFIAKNMTVAAQFICMVAALASQEAAANEAAPATPTFH